ncbi:hypothetical protein [Lacimonas salitolerans]|uniref:Uncharacterized protein n=1 Tax=Lacimonas salitolerans TaxID=1323750 RepID=A0ABW4ECK0_9RHOB
MGETIPPVAVALAADIAPNPLKTATCAIAPATPGLFEKWHQKNRVRARGRQNNAPNSRHIVPNDDTGAQHKGAQAAKKAGDPGMTKTRRWIKGVTDTAKATETPALPWQRGSRRAEMIARRDAKPVSPQRRQA